MRGKTAVRWLGVVSLLCAPLPNDAGAEEGIVVVVHERGKRHRFEGKEADDLARKCEHLVRVSTSGSQAVSTDDIRYTRANEVAIEVRFPEPKSIALSWRDTATQPQYLLIPLTGEDTGFSGNAARVYAGRHAPRDFIDAVAPLFEYGNPPDEYRIQYFAFFYTDEDLDGMREAVRSLGIEAPPPSPRPTETPAPPMNLEGTPLGPAGD